MFGGLIFGGAYIRREVCVSKSAIGSRNLRLKIYVSNLQNVLTETCLEDEDLSKTYPCKYFVYMNRGNQSQEWRGTTQTAINCDSFWLQTLGRHVTVLYKYKNLCYCTVFALFYFVFEGAFQVRGSGGFYSEGPIYWGAYFWNFTVRYYPVHRPANLHSLHSFRSLQLW